MLSPREPILRHRHHRHPTAFGHGFSGERASACACMRIMVYTSRLVCVCVCVIGVLVYIIIIARARSLVRRRSANTTGTHRLFNSRENWGKMFIAIGSPVPRARTLRTAAGCTARDVNARRSCRFRGNAYGPHRARTAQYTVLGHEFIGIAAASARSRLMALWYYKPSRCFQYEICVCTKKKNKK